MKRIKQDCQKRIIHKWCDKGKCLFSVSTYFNYEANQGNIFGKANHHSDLLVIHYIIVKPAVAQIQGLPGKCCNHIKTPFSQRRKEYFCVLDHTEQWIATKDVLMKHSKRCNCCVFHFDSYVILIN